MASIYDELDAFDAELSGTSVDTGTGTGSSDAGTAVATDIRSELDAFDSELLGGKPDFYRTGVVPEPPTNHTLAGLIGSVKGFASAIPGSTILSPVETVDPSARKYGNAIVDYIAKHEEIAKSIATGLAGATIAGKVAGIPGLLAFGGAQKFADIVKEKKKEAIAQGLPEPSIFDVAPEFGLREYARMGVASAFAGGGGLLGKAMGKSFEGAVASIGEKAASGVLNNSVTREIIKKAAAHIGIEATLDGVSAALEGEIDSAISGRTMTKEESLRNFLLSFSIGLASNAVPTAADASKAINHNRASAAIKQKLSNIESVPSLETPIDQPAEKIFVPSPGDGNDVYMKQEVTPPADPTRNTLSKQSLMQNMGLPEDQAMATEALVEAMGLDKNAIEVQKGGTPAEDALMQEEEKVRNAGFYSKLSKVVDEKVKQAMSREQLINILKNSGVKQEEIEWSDLDKLGNRVTPEEVKEHLAENAVVVEDIVLSGTPYERHEAIIEEIKAQIGQKEEHLSNLLKKVGYNGPKIIDEIEKWAERTNNKDFLEEYIETSKDIDQLSYDIKDLEKRGSITDYSRYTSAGGENYKEILFKVPKIVNDTSSKKHFRIENIVAHARVKDRMLPTGEKLLSVEEVQSDLHQRASEKVGPNGERRGYYSREQQKEAIRLRQELRDINRQIKETSTRIRKEYKEKNKIFEEEKENIEKEYPLIKYSTKNVPKDVVNRHRELSDLLFTAYSEGYDVINRETKPLKDRLAEINMTLSEMPKDAPFKKTWPNLVMKKMIDLAVREGHDAVVWMPGKEQSKRYGRMDDSEKGLEKFYDSIIPIMVDDIIKPYGTKIEDFSIPIDNGTIEAKGFRITPEMKATIQEKGQPLFQKDRSGNIKASVEFPEQGRALIRAFENSDVSSAVHEIAHIGRRFLLDKSIPVENRLGIDDEHIAIAERWAGAKDGVWDRKAEEKFARGFERYLRDGEAPSSSLSRIFLQFKNWLTSIYRTLVGTPLQAKISSEMRTVFDALVTRGEPKAFPKYKWEAGEEALFNGQIVKVIGAVDDGNIIYVQAPGDQKPRKVGVDTLSKVKSPATATTTTEEPTTPGEGDVSTTTPPTDIPIVDNTYSRRFSDRVLGPSAYLNRSIWRAIRIAKDSRVVDSIWSIYEANRNKTVRDQRSTQIISAVADGLTPEKAEIVLSIAGKDLESLEGVDPDLVKRATILRNFFDENRESWKHVLRKRLEEAYPREYAELFAFREEGIEPNSEAALTRIADLDIDPDTFRDFVAKYGSIDNWGFDNFITNIEVGPYAIVAHYTDGEGKKQRQTVGFTDKFSAEERIAEIKANPSKFPFLGALDKFEIVASSNAPNPLKQRHDILLGSGDLKKRLTAYARFMNKKIAFATMQDYTTKVAKELRGEGKIDLARMVEQERDSVVEGRSTITGSLNDLEETINSLIGIDDAVARATTRLTKNVARATFLADISNPVVQGLSDIIHVVTSMGQFGAKSGIRGIVSALSDRLNNAPAYKEFTERYSYLLGNTLHADIEGHLEGAYKESLSDTIASGLITGPANAQKKFLQYAMFKEFMQRGMSEPEAVKQATMATYLSLGIDDFATAGHLFRNSPGRLAGFMRKYSIKELEFLSTLTPRQAAFHIGAHATIFGPGIYLSLLKGLPLLMTILPNVAGWIDDAEEYIQKKIGRGYFGLLSGGTGLDFSRAANMIIPSSFEDTGFSILHTIGEVISTASKDIANEIGLSKKPITYKDDWEKILEKNVRLIRKIGDYMDQSYSNGWVLDSAGRRVYPIRSFADKWAPLLVPTVERSIRERAFYNIERRIKQDAEVQDRYLDMAAREVLRKGALSEDTKRILKTWRSLDTNFDTRLVSRILSKNVPKDIQQLLKVNNVDILNRIKEQLDVRPTQIGLIP